MSDGVNEPMQPPVPGEQDKASVPPSPGGEGREDALRPPEDAGPDGAGKGDRIVLLKDPGRQAAEQRAIETTRIGLTGIIRMVLIALVISVAANAGFGYALFWHFPGERWLWTSDARAVCAAVPLTEPGISDARVIDFAAGAVIDLNSFDYRNWQTTIDGVLSTRFTPAGRVAYLDAVDALLRRVLEGRYVVSAVSDGMPFLSDYGVAGGRRFWMVQVPYTIEYRTEADIRREHRVFLITVVRVEPGPFNPNGIAIDAVASTQRSAGHGGL